MKSLILFSLVLTFAFCSSGFLSMNLPKISNKTLNFTLDSKFQTKGIFGRSFGDVSVPVNLQQINTYFTSADCINCKIYGSTNEQPLYCSEDNFCEIDESFNDLKLDTNFIASGDDISLQMMFDDVPAYVSGILLVQKIDLFGDSQFYNFDGIGLYFDAQQEPTLLHSLKEQGKIDNYSYSFYLGADSNYHMMIGGFNYELISSQFYNMQVIDRPVPQATPYELFQANILINDVIIPYNMLVLLDPTIDTFIFPETYFPDFLNIYRSLSMMPDLSSFSIKQPGQWSSLSKSPNLTVKFVKDDQFAITNSLDLHFTSEEFMKKTPRGSYTPNMSFVETYGPLQNVVRMGKQIYQRLMYYRYVDEKNVYRCFAPLKETQLLNN